jgi:hypothetical protein
MATEIRRRPGRRLCPLYALEFRGQTAPSPSTRDEVRMPPQLHARPKCSTRPSEARPAPRLSCLPSVRACARHDGRRLDAAFDQEKAPVAGRRRVLVGADVTFKINSAKLFTAAARVPLLVNRARPCGLLCGRFLGLRRISCWNASGPEGRSLYGRDHSAEPIGTERRATSTIVPYLPCIGRRVGCFPNPASRSALRSCTRTTSIHDHASSRASQRQEIGPALRMFSSGRLMVCRLIP